jgi:hypothetical protein
MYKNTCATMQYSSPAFSSPGQQDAKKCKGYPNSERLGISITGVENRREHDKRKPNRYRYAEKGMQMMETKEKHRYSINAVRPSGRAASTGAKNQQRGVDPGSGPAS